MCLRNREEGSVARAKSVKESGVGNKVGVLVSRQIILGLISHVKGSGFLFLFFTIILKDLLIVELERACECVSRGEGENPR